MRALFVGGFSALSLALIAFGALDSALGQTQGYILMLGGIVSGLIAIGENRSEY